MSKINLHNYEAYLLDYFEGNLTEQEGVELKSFLEAHPELDVDLNASDFPIINDQTEIVDFKNNLIKSDADVTEDKLLNYLENNLSKSDTLEFEQQILLNSDLKRLLDQYKKTILKPTRTITFGNKAQLIKNEDDFILNNKFIAYFEKQLSLNEKVNFEKELLANPELQKELNLIFKTKLEVDKTLVYPNKAELKKKNKIIVLFSFRNVASMAAAILLLFGLFVVFNPNNSVLTSRGEVAANSNIKGSKTRLPSVKNSIKLPKSYTSDVKNIRHATKHIKIKHPKDSMINNLATHTLEINAVTNNTKQDTVIPSYKQELPKNETPIATVTNGTKTFAPIIISNTVNEKTNVANSIAVEYEDDEDSETTEPSSKNHFRKRIVSLAKQANKLGVKSVAAEEPSKDAFVFSFNSFSVEKK